MELMDFEVVDRNKSPNRTMDNRAIENKTVAGTWNEAKIVNFVCACAVEERIFFLCVLVVRRTFGHHYCEISASKM